MRRNVCYKFFVLQSFVLQGLQSMAKCDGFRARSRRGFESSNLSPCKSADSMFDAQDNALSMQEQLKCYTILAPEGQQ